MISDKVEIKTLTIDQLLTLTTWKKYSFNNILEISNDGHFGLYVQPTGIKKRTYNVNTCLSNLINAKNISSEERTYYQQLDEKLILFKKQHGHLFKRKLGYERLATQLESEVFQLSYTCAISRIIEDKKIPFF